MNGRITDPTYEAEAGQRKSRLDLWSDCPRLCSRSTLDAVRSGAADIPGPTVMRFHFNSRFHPKHLDSPVSQENGAGGDVQWDDAEGRLGGRAAVA